MIDPFKKLLKLSLPLLLFVMAMPREYASIADQQPPVVTAVTPTPAAVLTNLTQLTVTFSRPVTGVDAIHFLVNNVPATSVIGSGTTYTFQLDRPDFGPVDVRWAPEHVIADLAQPPHRFDESADTAHWNYTLEDKEAPTIADVAPLPNLSVRQLAQIQISFSESVEGVDASALLLNGRPATNVSGFGSGPYLFSFNPITAVGTATVEWAQPNQIQDLSGNAIALSTVKWTYKIDPIVNRSDIIINEFLAANETGLRDEDGEYQDWIELYNRGNLNINLAGWSLTDDPKDPGQWVFPSVALGPGQYLVVFASGKDRRSPGSLHTNFKLSTTGEYIGLSGPELPRAVVDQVVDYPAQRNDYSYGRTATGAWAYMQKPTPNGANAASSVQGIAEPVHFSVTRGFFDAPFMLALTTETPGAVIRYTIDGSEPTETKSILYSAPIQISKSTLVRAAAFKSDYLPSAITTHSYLFGVTAARRSLPAISLVTATNNLVGPTGIMSASPRNTTKHGLAWERPVSVEYIRGQDNDGFQLDAGIRVQGGAYIRGLYNPNSSTPPQGKYSFRLYFRGDYGSGKLDYPVLGDLAVKEFNHIVLRAGMNDSTNPFILDELVRRLFSDTGEVSSHGAVANLFLNGVYKGYYNPTERIDSDFLQSWHGGSSNWDLIAQAGELREGSTANWNSMLTYFKNRDLSQAANYVGAGQRLDLTNFVDYLLVNAYAATGDWPQNNWRAARQNAPEGRFRFYIWDAEWSFGIIGNNPISHNEFATELGGSTEIATLYKRLRLNPEFNLLFADRIQKHFFNKGALTDTNILNRFLELKNVMKDVLPAMNTTIQRTWIPQRRGIVMKQFETLGFGAYSNAPALNQHGGAVPEGYPLTLSAPAGRTIYYTTNGSDPRISFTGEVDPAAAIYAGTPVPLNRDLTIKARSLSGTNWSAITEASFQVAETGPPVRFTEIMYNPAAGDAYEFLELKNFGSTAIDLGFMTFSGVEFTFPPSTRLESGAVIVLASGSNPSAFAAHYPNLTVAGHFHGSLSNGGEEIALLDRNGNMITSVSYDDENGWPTEADGGGYSLELIDPNGDPDSPANWRASAALGGSPGAFEIQGAAQGIVINEIMADNVNAVANGPNHPDWVELRNLQTTEADLSGWSLTDGGNPRKFVFPAGTFIAAGSYLIVWCDAPGSTPGLHTGFALGREGADVLLYDAKTNRIDAASFGPQVPDLSIGRAGEAWALTMPTPNAPNVAASLGSAQSLVINEWMANPVPGAEDWIELYNGDKSHPVALTGISVSNGSASSRILSLSFVPPGGYVQLHADGNSGANHLDFKLPAAGGTIVLSDSLGAEINRVTYSAQAEGISEGRLPDGSASVMRFPGTESPGAPNFVLGYTGPRLNEFMARHPDLPQDSGAHPADWIELYNPSSTAADISGMALSVKDSDPEQWKFPPGTTIPAKGFLVIWADDTQSATTKAGSDLNIGRALAGEGGGIYLFNVSKQLVDSVTYGFQLTGQSVGVTDSGWALLAVSTPGRANASSALLGAPESLRLNEWMADPVSGNDWVELYNLEPQPVSLTGIYLTDDPSIAGKTNYQAGPLSYIAPNGWVKWEADGDRSQGSDHLSFKLAKEGGALRLYGSNLFQIDSVDFGPSDSGVSEGRLPDGAVSIVKFATTSSPGESNYLAPSNAVVNEVLGLADAPFESAIELYNPSREDAAIGGWYLSDDSATLQKYRIPDGTTLPAKGYAVFYATQLNASGSLHFTFSPDQANSVILSAVDNAGNLTGYRSIAKFGPAEKGVSFGRYQTSHGSEFVALDHRTFGADDAASSTEFRRGSGRLNDYPKVGPVVINEIMYHPSTLIGTNNVENEEEEFVELFNSGNQPVALFDSATGNAWKLSGGVDFTFSLGLTLASQEYLIVANFDPLTNNAALANFRARFSVPAGSRIVGPYHGKLSNTGDTIELLRPLTATAYAVADHVQYQAHAPWPSEAAGEGASLQRLRPADYGNDAVNWRAGQPTAGRLNMPNPSGDRDQDGLPDDWELANGLDPNSALDALADNDGDGLTNLQEYQSGTYPQNPESALRLEPVLTSHGPSLVFVAPAGKSFTVQSSANLAQGIWETVLQIQPSPTNQVVEFKGMSSGATGARFYRVVVP